jgi:hypothetical protein
MGTGYTMAQWNTWKSTTGYDANSPTPSDPLFINVTSPMETDSLMIGALSPAKDVGIGVGINTDYRDSLRDASPDIGAYEQGAIGGDPPPAVAPTVTTTTPVIKNSRATTGGGNVTDIGGSAVTKKGIAWSVNPNPDIGDSIKSGGSGAGAFTAWIGLTAPNGTYHTRAYAINATDTVYGQDIEFQTPNSIYSDSLSVGAEYIDSLFIRNDSLIFRGVDGKEFKIEKYFP